MGVARHRHLLCVVGSVKLRQFDDVATGGWKLVVNLVDSVLNDGINFGLPKNQLSIESFEHVSAMGGYRQVNLQEDPRMLLAA